MNSTLCQVNKSEERILVEVRESRHVLNIDGVVLDKSNRGRPQGKKCEAGANFGKMQRELTSISASARLTTHARSDERRMDVER